MLIRGPRVIVGSVLSALVCLLVIESPGCDMPGLHIDRVILSDRTARSVALARDIASFRILLAARPSPAWGNYFEHWIAGTGFEDELRTLAGSYTAALNGGAIVWVPNGTLGNETDHAIIRGGAATRAGHRKRGFAQAIRITLREEPNRGVEGWTIPDILQHERALAMARAMRLSRLGDPAP